MVRYSLTRPREQNRAIQPLVSQTSCNTPATRIRRHGYSVLGDGVHIRSHGHRAGAQGERRCHVLRGRPHDVPGGWPQLRQCTGRV